jgi:hypothetical protein
MILMEKYLQLLYIEQLFLQIWSFRLLQNWTLWNVILWAGVVTTVIVELLLRNSYYGTVSPNC